MLTKLMRIIREINDERRPVAAVVLMVLFTLGMIFAAGVAHHMKPRQDLGKVIYCNFFVTPGERKGDRFVYAVEAIRGSGPKPARRKVVSIWWMRGDRIVWFQIPADGETIDTSDPRFSLDDAPANRID